MVTNHAPRISPRRQAERTNRLFIDRFLPIAGCCSIGFLCLILAAFTQNLDPVRRSLHPQGLCSTPSLTRLFNCFFTLLPLTVEVVCLSCSFGEPTRSMVWFDDTNSSEPQSYILMLEKHQDIRLWLLLDESILFSAAFSTTRGFTHQYWQLNALTELLPSTAFAALGVPCNQFGHQEPAANKTELYAGLRYVRPGKNYVPAFSLTMKADVNGKDELSLYTSLKRNCPSPGHTSFSKTETFWDPIKPSDVSWNFEKFLLLPNGVPVYRFSPDVEPLDLQPLIVDLIDGGYGQALLLAELEEKVAERVKEREAGHAGKHHP